MTKLRHVTLQRKRKRRLGSNGQQPSDPDADNVSICSLDLENGDQPETKKKKLPRFVE